MRRKMKKVLNLAIVLTLLLSIVPTVSFAQSTSIKDEQNRVLVEAFVTETLEMGKEGFYEETGYERVNIVTESNRSLNEVTTKVYKLADYYDLDGNFLRSIILHDEFINDLSTGKALYKQNELELNQPITKYLDGLKINEVTELNNVKQNELSQYVTTQINKLNDIEYSETAGYTQEDIDELVKLINEQPPEVFVIETEGGNELAAANGAYDNYYNTNNYNGNFTIQALGAAKQRYVKVTGNSVGNTKNANSLTTFQRNIDNYKEYIIRHMEAERWTEVGSWWSRITSFVSFATGISGGPAGWATIVSRISSAFQIFENLTSRSYATQTRLSYSRTASSYLNNASYMVINTGSYWDLKNVKVSTHLGY